MLEGSASDNHPSDSHRSDRKQRKTGVGITGVALSSRGASSDPAPMSNRAAPDRGSVTEVKTQPVKRFSRDEMNLAEFPLAVLSTRHDSTVKTLEFSDSLTGKNGERIERKWVITGADKFGLPTASDDEVLLGLLRLSASQEFRSRKIEFTRYELLRILKWSTEGRSYVRLQRALDRLSGVRIKTSNGFFDNSTKSHQTRNFGIIDAYELNDSRAVAQSTESLANETLADDTQSEDAQEGGDLDGSDLSLGRTGERNAHQQRTQGADSRAHLTAEASNEEIAAGKEMATVKPSYFIWSEQMFHSFQSGFIKKLDLDFLLDLSSAISKRLYRFLDKHFWYRAKVSYNLFTLAHEKIGVSRNYAYASQLKQQLQPAIDELIAKGFLSGCEYVGKGKETEITLIAGSGTGKAAVSVSSSNDGQRSTVTDSGTDSGSSRGASSKSFAATQSHATGRFMNQTANPAMTQKVGAPRQNGDGDRGLSAEHSSAPRAAAAFSATKGSATRGSAFQRSETGLSDESVDSQLAEALTARGLAHPQAIRLASKLDPRSLDRAWAVLQHFDDLMQTNSGRISRNPAGFLYRAIERLDAFVLPGEQRERGSETSAERRAIKSGGAHIRERSSAAGKGRRTVSQNTIASQMQEQISRESSQRTAVRAARNRLKEEVEPELLARIRQEVQTGLEKVRGLISPSRFEETVEHAVEERLAKLFAL